eukprot:1999152-Alexandrium_andersonii.AAC.1
MSFWSEIYSLKLQGSLDTCALAILEGHGFAGGDPGQASAPVLEILEQAFRAQAPEEAGPS